MQEESPLSTRVHELAKELGLKSQDLVDRIQEWGFKVKPSIFAGLDPEMVEQIRARQQESPASGAAGACRGSEWGRASSIMGKGLP